MSEERTNVSVQRLVRSSCSGCLGKSYHHTCGQSRYASRDALPVRERLKQIEEMDKILVAVYRAFHGGSDYVQHEARRLVDQYIGANSQDDTSEG